ncbi:hypothetical protein J22TS1_19240 [Siminovitchia terrae]|nr:hypothetical protein J22TS1_19240 [Siminovitchia terrae]
MKGLLFRVSPQAKGGEYLRRAAYQGDSLELLVSDLIFKLGKANQQIHSLSQRVHQLELLLNQQTPEHLSSTKTYDLLEKH